MSEKVISIIKKRISGLNYGDIIVTTDFLDITSATTARQCLGRLVKEKLIRRIMDGIYEKPRYSEFLGEYVPADPNKVALKIASRYSWKIVPSGDVVLNQLGLSTQVPAVWVYVSDGPYRTFSWDNVTIKFKHRTNRELSQLSKNTALIIEAIRTLGKERIDEKVIIKLRELMDSDDRENVLRESRECSEWIYNVIREVCN